MLALKWQSQDWNPSLSEFKALVLFMYTLLLVLDWEEPYVQCWGEFGLDHIGNGDHWRFFKIGSGLDSFTCLKDHCVERAWGKGDWDWGKVKERRGGPKAGDGFIELAGWLGGDDVTISQIIVLALNPSMVTFNQGINSSARLTELFTLWLFTALNSSPSLPQPPYTLKKATFKAWRQVTEYAYLLPVPPHLVLSLLCTVTISFLCPTSQHKYCQTILPQLTSIILPTHWCRICFSLSITFLEPHFYSSFPKGNSSLKQEPTSHRFPSSRWLQLDRDAKAMCNLVQKGTRKLGSPSNVAERNPRVLGGPKLHNGCWLLSQYM